MDKQAKILLVDDDPDFVESTKMVLESKSYQVITALSGDEGLKKAKEGDPDLIILDVIMPGKDGFTVCQELKSNPQLSQVPVLMLTGFAEKYMDASVSVSQGLTLEAEDFIDKPVTPDELLIRVERLLKRAAA